METVGPAGGRRSSWGARHRLETPPAGTTAWRRRPAAGATVPNQRGARSWQPPGPHTGSAPAHTGPLPAGPAHTGPPNTGPGHTGPPHADPWQAARPWHRNPYGPPTPPPWHGGPVTDGGWPHGVPVDDPRIDDTPTVPLPVLPAGAWTQHPADPPLVPAVVPSDSRSINTVPVTPRVMMLTARQLASDAGAVVDAVVQYLRPGPLHADLAATGPERHRTYLEVYARLPMGEFAAPLGVVPAAVATGAELLDMIADNTRLIRLKRARQRLEGIGHNLLATPDGADRANHPLLPPLGRILGVTGVAGAIGDSTTATSLGDSVVREMVRTWIACAIVESTNQVGAVAGSRRARAAERRALNSTYRATIRYNVTLLGTDPRALAIERVRSLLALHDMHGHALDGAWADVINLIYMMEEARRHIAAGLSIPVPVVRFFDELRREPSRPSRVPFLRTLLRLRHR